MAENKPLEIIGRTAILAAIYDPDNLPSAIVAVDNSSLWCLHSLRENDLTFFEEKFMPCLRVANNVPKEETKKDEELKIKLYKFFEDYPKQSYICHGCAYGEDTGKTSRHTIKQSDEVCTKSTEDCA